MATLRARVGELETTRGAWRTARECSDSELLFVIDWPAGATPTDAELEQIARAGGVANNKEGAEHGRSRVVCAAYHPHKLSRGSQ